MKLLLPIAALVGLSTISACTTINEVVPPQLVTVACGLGPIQFPDYADEINLACAGYSASQLVQLQVVQQ